MNVNNRKFFRIKNSIMTRFTSKSSQPSILSGTEPELWTAVGSRLCMVERRYRVTVWNWLCLVFISIMKNMIEEAKLFSLHPYIKWFTQAHGRMTTATAHLSVWSLVCILNLLCCCSEILRTQLSLNILPTCNMINYKIQIFLMYYALECPWVSTAVDEGN